MAGRHRKQSAWRRLLTSLVRSRDRARTAALQADVVALRATVASLRAELARVQAEATAAEQHAIAVQAAAARTAEGHAAQLAEAREQAELAQRAVPSWLTLRMPLVQLALGDPDDVASGPEVAAALAAPDRSPDSAETEIVLATTPTPAPADRLAWSVLANLPERPLLDPKLDRDAEPRDPAAVAGQDTARFRAAG